MCLVAAVAMLAQIPYSLDEIVATCQFVRRRQGAGQPWLRVLLFGDTDEGDPRQHDNPFERPPLTIARDMFSGGVNLPWNLAACMAIGIWLMSTRLTLGADGSMANADHLIGSLALTVAVIACAEVARPVRFLNVILGAALCVTPFLYDASTMQMLAALICGAGLVVLSVPRGCVSGRYAGWNWYIR